MVTHEGECAEHREISSGKYIGGECKIIPR